MTTPDTIGHYNIMEEMGRGGMGIVYRARDSRSGQIVAVKVIRPDQQLDLVPKQMARFAREAQTIQQLNHPHIVTILDVDLQHTPPYFVMAYLPGGNLTRRMHAPLPWRETLTLLRPLVEALVYTHRVGIIHRDLKPSNIMFGSEDPGSLKLVDFGLAYQEGSSRLTTAGYPLGTPAYLAPEQARGLPVDQRTDIFALGIILIELTTGHNPLDRGGVIPTLNELSAPSPVDTSTVSGSPGLRHLIERAVRKDRKERFPNCEALLVDLDNCLEMPSGYTTIIDTEAIDQGPQIRAGGQVELDKTVKYILRRMFPDDARLTVVAEFGRSFSGSRIFLIHRHQERVHPLPTVVKIAPVGLIQQEWQAYERWVKEKLVNAAAIDAPPALDARAAWDGLRYTLAGGGVFEFQNLSDYCRRQTSGDDIRRLLEGTLFKALYQRWWLHDRPDTIILQDDYDEMLPVNLWLEQTGATSDEAPVIGPENRPPSSIIKEADSLRLQGFEITEIDYPDELTLNLPHAPEDVTPPSYRIRIRNVPDLEAYQVGNFVDDLPVWVAETRHSYLLDQARLAFDPPLDVEETRLRVAGVELPNPLTLYESLLAASRLVKLGPIHGDLNLENILVVDDSQIRLIDFATVREGHLLHDLLRLETDTVIKVLAGALEAARLPASTIYELYRQLHLAVVTAEAAIHLPDPALEKPMAMLLAIRLMARKCLLDEAKWAEYYEGLTLYLLGALKFGRATGPSLSKQLAFLGAAVAAAFLEGEFVNIGGTTVATIDNIQTGEPIMSEEKKEERHYHAEGDGNVVGEGNVVNNRNVRIEGNRNVTGDINIGGAVSGNVVIGGDQTIQTSPPPPTASELVTQAKTSLGLGDYSQTLVLCNKAIEADPHHAEANLLAAIALMHGRGADQLGDHTVERVEAHLLIAQDDPATEVVALVILGLVKYDHYIANGKFAGKPSLKMIKARLRSFVGEDGPHDKRLNYIKASGAAWKRLGLELE